MMSGKDAAGPETFPHLTLDCLTHEAANRDGDAWQEIMRGLPLELTRSSPPSFVCPGCTGDFDCSLATIPVIGRGYNPVP